MRIMSVTVGLFMFAAAGTAVAQGYYGPNDGYRAGDVDTLSYVFQRLSADLGILARDIPARAKCPTHVDSNAGTGRRMGDLIRPDKRRVFDTYLQHIEAKAGRMRQEIEPLAAERRGPDERAGAEPHA